MAGARYQDTPVNGQCFSRIAGRRAGVDIPNDLDSAGDDGAVLYIATNSHATLTSRHSTWALCDSTRACEVGCQTCRVAQTRQFSLQRPDKPLACSSRERLPA